jgi:sec-independent protein translocase protein TatA
MPNLGGWEVFAILAVVVLLFGAKRLPDLARGSGRALRIFKTEVKGLEDDGKDEPKPLEASEADKKPEQG